MGLESLHQLRDFLEAPILGISYQTPQVNPTRLVREIRPRGPEPVATWINRVIINNVKNYSHMLSKFNHI